MLILEPQTKRGQSLKMERVTPYHILLNGQKIGSFQLYFQSESDYDNLLGWADQYSNECYWGEHEALLRLVSNLELAEKNPHSFIYLTDLQWELPVEERWVKDQDGFNSDELLTRQLKHLHQRYQVTRCYLDFPESIESSREWETILKEEGFEVEALTYFVLTDALASH